jgi:hypothetical protein
MGLVVLVVAVVVAPLVEPERLFVHVPMQMEGTAT